MDSVGTIRPLAGAQPTCSIHTRTTRGTVFCSPKAKGRGGGRPCCVLFRRAKRQKGGEEAEGKAPEHKHATRSAPPTRQATLEARARPARPAKDLCCFGRLRRVPMSCAGAGQAGGWLLDYGLVEEEIQGSEFIYMVDDPAVSSVILGFDAPRKEYGVQDNSGAKKRSRPESSAPPGTKACREKLRRDRLNERFNELCAILEPGKPPKADKVAILSDAARLLNQLRTEAQKLKQSNESLQDSIKSLKAEKSELRDEKTRLKAERERLEQMLKGVSHAAAVAPGPFVPHPTAAAAPSFHPAAAFAQAGKFVPYPSYPPPAAFWQWIPPTSLDTAKDPAHWPPVA